MLDPDHATHIQGEVDQIRGLLLALEEIDKSATERVVSNDAHTAVLKALHRALDDVTALIEGYTEPPAELRNISEAATG